MHFALIPKPWHACRAHVDRDSPVCPLAHRSCLLPSLLSVHAQFVWLPAVVQAGLPCTTALSPQLLRGSSTCGWISLHRLLHAVHCILISPLLQCEACADACADSGLGGFAAFLRVKPATFSSPALNWVLWWTGLLRLLFPCWGISGPDRSLVWVIHSMLPPRRLPIRVHLSFDNAAAESASWKGVLWPRSSAICFVVSSIFRRLSRLCSCESYTWHPQ